MSEQRLPYGWYRPKEPKINTFLKLGAQSGLWSKFFKTKVKDIGVLSASVIYTFLQVAVFFGSVQGSVIAEKSQLSSGVYRSPNLYSKHDCENIGEYLSGSRAVWQSKIAPAVSSHSTMNLSELCEKQLNWRIIFPHDSNILTKTFISSTSLEQALFFVNNSEFPSSRLKFDSRLPEQVLTSQPSQPSLLGETGPTILTAQLRPLRASELSDASVESSDGVERSQISFDVELASDIFSTEACANFKSLFADGQGPWQLKPGDFGNCYASSADSISKLNSLNHWKIQIETKGKKLSAAICRPLPRQASVAQKCYSEISVFSNANYFEVLKDARFIVQLTAALYEQSPVASHSVADQIPGRYDARLPEQLASPPELQPIQLIYIKNGELFKRVEIDQTQINYLQGKKVFWTKTRLSSSRRSKFIFELEYFLRSVFKNSQSSQPSVVQTNVDSADPSVKIDSARKVTTPILPLKFENLSNVTKDVALAKEKSQKADADARAAAAKASAARAFAEQQQELANAALRDAEAKKLAAKVALEREEVAKKRADEELAKRDALAKEAAARELEKKSAAAREAVLNAKKAREVADKAEAEARAALEAARLPASSIENQSLVKKDRFSSKSAPNSDLNSNSSAFQGFSRSLQHFVIMVGGIPMQQTYRDRLPAVFSIGLENQLWSLATFKVGVWGHLERIFFNQNFNPDVISDTVQDSSVVPSLIARGERTESQVGILFAHRVAFNQSLFRPSLRLASNHFSSVLSYDRSQLIQEPRKIDGISTVAGVSLTFEPNLQTNGAIIESTFDFLFGRMIDGRRVAQNVGWRIFEDQDTFNVDVFGDFQHLSVFSKRELDDTGLAFRTNRVALGLKFHLF